MTAPATIRKYAPGDRVRVTNSTKFSGLGTVEKQMPKNVLVVLDTGQRVRFDPFFLQPANSLNPPVVASVAALAMALPTGTFVKYTGPFDKRLTGVWVVIGDQGGKTRIARPGGGDNGRYWRIPNGQLAKVECVVTEVPA
jgi:hypothetical protein